MPFEPGRTSTVSLAQPGVAVSVHVYNRAQRKWPFCTDVIIRSDDVLEETWRATGRTMAIELSPRGVLAAQPEMYRATIHITGAEFISASGPRVAQTQPMTLTAIVGLMY